MAYQLRVEPDGARRFVHVSPSCEALNGVSAEAVLADAGRLYELIAPEHRERMAEAEAGARASLSAFEVEVQMILPGGERRWRRIASAPRPAEDGAVIWDGMQIDVTERKEMEAELAESRRRLRLAVEATGLGFWEFDPAAERLSWSDRTKALFGLPADTEVSLGDFLKAVPSSDRERIVPQFQAVLAQPDGGDFAYEHRARAPDGEVRWLLTHGRVSVEPDGRKLVVGTSLDITERKLAEERRTLVMRELAHRAQNGLAVIMAILNQTAQNADTLEDYVATVNARLQAMAASQSLVTETNQRRANLSSLLDAVLEPFDRGRFDIDPQVEEIGITGDLALGLALLTHELATNALKYGSLSNVSGRVLIRRVDAESGRARVDWREVGGPPVVASSRTGFGTRLLQAALRGQGGRVEGRFEPDGFTARLEFPAPAP